MALDKFGKPYGSSWEGMSMGEGRQVVSITKTCPKSKDGYHHYTAVSNVQSVEHFVCDDCGDEYWD